MTWYTRLWRCAAPPLHRASEFARSSFRIDNLPAA